MLIIIVMRRSLLTIVILATLFLVARAGESTGSITVSVTVSEQFIVDVNPKVLTYSGNPGSLANPTDNNLRSDTATKSYYITITNLGSVNVTSIRASVDLPTQNPWGSGDASKHKSGDFILISKEGSFQYVTQRLFNETPPYYVFPPTGCPDPASWDPTQCQFYILRTVNDNLNTGEDWFIFVKKGATDYTDGTIYVATLPRNTTITGTTNFATITGASLTSSGSYGYKVFDTGIGNKNYLKGVFVINSTGSEAYFSYWGVDIIKKALTSADQYYLCLGSVSSPCLYPSQSVSYLVQVRIPYGVQAGAISGNLYIIVSS